MPLVLDLGKTDFILREEDPRRYDWSELAHLWNRNDMDAVHDWLNERWSRLIQSRMQGAADPDARFLQGLAFAALALFFTQNRNQVGALLCLDDALMMLAAYRPAHFGIRVDPVLETLDELRPLIVGLGQDDECPMQPFVYRKMEFQQ